MLLQGTQSSTEHHPLGCCSQKASGAPKPLSQNIMHISHHFISEKANKNWNIAVLSQWVELNRDAPRTRQCCHRNSKSFLFPSEIISDLSFTDVNLCYLGHETVSLYIVGKGKTQHPDLLGTGSSERSQRDTGRGHRSTVNFPVGLCCARAPFRVRRWEQGSPTCALLPASPGADAATPPSPNPPALLSTEPLSPRCASKAFLKQ